VLDFDCAERDPGHGAQDCLLVALSSASVTSDSERPRDPDANMISAAPQSSLKVFATTGLLFLLSLSQVNAQLLANGSYFQSGSISTNWLWQASGTLTHGRCPWTISRFMSDCYKMYVSIPRSGSGIPSDRGSTCKGPLIPPGTWNRQPKPTISQRSKSPRGLDSAALSTSIRPKPTRTVHISSKGRRNMQRARMTPLWTPTSKPSLSRPSSATLRSRTRPRRYALVVAFEPICYPY
jgi:hypothetical protein